MLEHLTRDELAALAEGRLSRQAQERVLAHLVSCGACRSRASRRHPGRSAWLDSVLANVSALERPGGQEYQRAFDRAFTKLDLESDRLSASRAAAPELLAELLAQPPQGRHLLIRNLARFQSWGLAELMLQEAERVQAADSGRSAELARLALAVADRLGISAEIEAFVHDLRARAWSQIGNASRVSNDLVAAEAAFETAWSYHRQGSGDPLEKARLLALTASLLRTQRRLGEAEAQLVEAVRTYRRGGASHRAGMAMINLANVLREQERHGEAIVQLERAAKLVRAEREPRLVLVLRQNLAAMLNETGRAAEAKALLPQARQLALRHGTRPDQLRLLWLSGLVDFNLGLLDEAEKSLAEVRSGFLSEGHSFDVGLVTLDLACLAMRRHALPAARLLVAEAIPIFEAAQVARELLAALAIFAQASEREATAWTGLAEIIRSLRHRTAHAPG